MPDGVMRPPGEGEHITGGGLDARLKATTDFPALYSSFEIVVPPGYDVGAHVHELGEEVFFVLEGELELFAFEPQDRSDPDWHAWRAADGRGPIRGGPGLFMFVPEDCPHAFSNPGEIPARFFFQSSVPGGHENYFRELAELLAESGGRPDPAASEELRQRWHIRQLTPIRAVAS